MAKTKVHNDSYTKRVTVKRTGSMKSLKFDKTFTHGWPDYWRPEDFTAIATEQGGIHLDDGEFIPMHTIESIKFEDPKE